MKSERVFGGYLRRHGAVWILGIAGVILGGELIFQVLFPSDHLVFGTEIDERDYGGWSKDDVTADLAARYEDFTFLVSVVESGESYELEAKRAGILVDHAERLEGLEYPWYLRLVPSSVFWYGNFVEAKVPKYNYDEGLLETYLLENLAAEVYVAARDGVVTMKNFVEFARDEGAVGWELDIEATLAAVIRYLADPVGGIVAKMIEIEPRVDQVWELGMEDEELSALIAGYAGSHAGTYGVQLMELSGEYRLAGVGQDTQFITASTYKLFVAYSVILAVERGDWGWDDMVVSGYSVAGCFDRMIEFSDNTCAELMMRRYGPKNITADIRELGLSEQSGWINGLPRTTAKDLAIFLGKLSAGQLPVAAENRERLLAAMKRNVYRQGIPSGTKAVVADKVGFLYALLHDAAIVYSEKGTYVLVILTRSASWGGIAGLAEEIEGAR